MVTPCPFCGAHLVEDSTGWAHPRGPCWLGGLHVGKANGERWNRRALSVEDHGGRPVFNEEGRGRPVDAALLNQIVIYLEERQM